METTVTKKVKTASYRPKSKMDFIVASYKSGMTKIEDLANAMKEAEESGAITGLKKTDAESVAKKSLAYYKKTVNWYLNQAKHKKFIDAPLLPRKRKIAQEVLQAQAEIAVQSEVVSAPVESQEVVSDNSDSSMIPTI